jgi:hypothetical protein
MPDATSDKLTNPPVKCHKANNQSIPIDPELDTPGPSHPPPPPSPAEAMDKFWLIESKPAEETVLGSSSRPANAATTKSGSINKKDLSGISRCEKQSFWGWLCDEDGRVDVTHPAFTRFRPH